MQKWFLGAVLVIAFLALGIEVQGQEATLRAGVAVTDMCPPVGVPLAGYGGGKRRLDFPDFDPDNYNVLLAPSDGILDPLMAKALVLESAGVKIAIIKLDSIGVSGEMVADIAKKISSTGIDAAHLTIVGTHTHSGPGDMCKGLFWEVAAVDLFDKRIYDPMVDKLARLVIEADANSAPARLGVGTVTSSDLSKNRRNHPGVIDPVIGVFKVEKADGSPLAILFNFAVHGTCLGTSNLKMSADVMGYAERYIEKVMKDQNTPACALFVNGSQGDVAPAKGGLDGAKIVGDALGAKVLEILPGITTRSSVPIAVANCDIHFTKAHLNVELWNGNREGEIDCLALRDRLYELMPFQRAKLKIEITGMVPLSFRLQAIRLGDVAIACIPGEPITNVGRMTKTLGDKAGFERTFIFGLANGHMGYLCDKENFDEGGYEAMMNIYGRDAADIICAKFVELFAQLQKQQ